MARGLQEMTRFGLAFGAQKETFFGLSGLGDLFTTCSSPLSRNWRAGNLLAQKCDSQDIVKKLNSVAEGIRTTDIIRKIALERGINMPITEQVSNVLNQKTDPGKAINNLMIRELTTEQ